MSRLFAEKTHEPTPYRRQTARREGHSARSSEVVGAFVIGGFVLCSPLFVGPVWQICQQLLRDSLSAGTGTNGVPVTGVATASPVDVVTIFCPVVGALGPILAALGGGVFLLAVLGNVLQRSVGWKPDRLAPNLARLHPAARIHESLSPRKLLMAWASLARFLVTLPIVLGWLWTQRDAIARLSLLETLDLADQWVALATEAMLVAACCVGLSAALDYGIQWWARERSLRMTPEEVRDELRRRDGDPQVRNQRRARHADLAHTITDK